MWRLFFLPIFLVIGGCNSADSTAEGQDDMSGKKELIVVASVSSNDTYYAETADAIFDFHVSYGRAVLRHDDFLVLTDDNSFTAYADALGHEHVAIAPQQDIWVRDFGLSNPTNPIMFRYTSAGQGGGRRGQGDADYVQDLLAATMEAAKIKFTETELLNDGGNFVDDDDGRVVVSRKFLRDNGLSEAEGRLAIMNETGASHVAFIEADEQGGLEHADGVVAFVDANVLVINSYPDDPEYAAALRSDLIAALPDVEIHEITSPYDDSKIFDEKFGSACGLYTNMLVTPERIYLPQFGIAEDKIALAKIKSVTSKPIIPVRSERVCHMGGGVRCMSWQLRGDNAVKLKAWAAAQKN